MRMTLLVVLTGFTFLCAGTTDSAPIYFEDFEAGAGGYTTGGAGSNWELGFPTSGPSGPYSGVNCWGTGVASDYNSNAAAWLRSPTIDLSGLIPGTVELSFYYWAHTETIVDVYEASILDPVSSAPLQVVMSGSGGPTGGWTPVTVGLTVPSEPIVVQFSLTSDDTIEYSGYYIDDVLLTGSPIPEPALVGLTACGLAGLLARRRRMR